MKPFLFFLNWAGLSWLFLVGGFFLVAIMFGREGNYNHLAGYAVLLVIWVTASVLAWRAWARGPERPE